MNGSPRIRSARLLQNADYVDRLLTLIAGAKARFYAHVFLVDCRLQADAAKAVRRVIRALAAAVERGVEVKLLVGDSRTAPEISLANRTSAAYSHALGIPTRLVDVSGKTSTHCKYVIVDGEVFVTGSHNWEPRAFTAYIEDSVEVSSPALAAELEQAFKTEWLASAQSDALIGALAADAPPALRSIGSSPVKPAAPLQSARAMLIEDAADGQLIVDGAYPSVVAPLLAAAQSTIRLVMFLATPAAGAKDGVGGLVAQLIQAAKRGVDAMVLLDRDATGQVFGSRIINKGAYKQLEAAGVPVRFDSTERVTHSKVLVIDGKDVVIGSHNWTQSSFTAYREASVHLVSSRLAEVLSADFAARWRSAGASPPRQASGGQSPSGSRARN